jgi:hypothetical protein
MNRILSLSVFLLRNSISKILFAFAFLFGMAYNASAQTAIAPSSGTGTELDPYKIATLENLYWIAATDAVVASPNRTARWSAHYIQTANIDASSTSTWFSNAGWLPIGNATTQFTGEYDGRRYTISNLFISRSTIDYVGLFGSINYAEISNVSLTNVNITGQSNVGALVGRVHNSSNVTNSNAQGVVAGANSVGNNNVGGLVGNLEFTNTLSGSFANVNVTGYRTVGGLVGNNNSSAVSTSYATGSVNAGNAFVGGLIGGVVSGSVTNSFARGAVSGGSYVGGLVGVLQGSTISKSYSTGLVTGSGGGLIGDFFVSRTVTDSFWDTETSGRSTSAAGGTGKTTAEMKTQSTFTDAGWDFTSIWGMCGSGVNNGYPYIQSLMGEIASVAPTIGAGTSGSPYQIATLANLKWITESSARWSLHYIQTAHINATATANWNCGLGWSPIGISSTTVFSGSYNGNGFTISNLTVNRPSSSYIGLFGYTINASIQKLALVDSKIAGYSYVGALIGRMSGGSLTNSYSQGNASVTSSWSYTGGLVGYATGSITNSYSQGQVTSSSIYVGGIVGATRELVISKSYSSSTVTGSSSVGGLVGWSTFDTNISNTYASGDVTSTVTNSGSFSYTGGLVGNVSSAIPITNSYSVSKVTAIGLQVGGLIGYTGGTVSNSFYDSETSGRSDTGKGVPKTTAEMKTQSTFTTWDFTASTGVWNINPTGYISYPYLQAITYDAPEASPAVNPIPGLAPGPTDYTWTGGTGDGSVGVNWNNGMPPAGSDIVIPEGATPYPVFSNNMVFGNITIGANATLTMAPSFRLDLTEDSEITIATGGKLILKSDGTGTAYIGTLTGTSQISGTVLQERYIMGSNRSFRFMGHPFNTAIPLSALGDKIDITGAGTGFTPTATNEPSAFYYNPATGDGNAENDGGWKAFTSITDNWNQYQGIRVLVRGTKGQAGSFDDIEYTPAAVTFEWEGEVNTGPQTIDLAYGYGDIFGTDEQKSDFNLVGNPFPSAIDLKAISRSGLVGGSFYIWQPREGSSGISGRGGAYLTEPFETGNPTFILPTGGAFFVRSGEPDQTLTIEEADKVNSNEPLQGTAGSTLRMDSNVASKYGSNSLQLVLSSEGDWWDRSLLFFNNESKGDSRVQEDATKLANPEVNFFTVSADNYAMAIDSRPYRDSKGINGNENRIALHLLSPSRTYTLSVPDFDLEAGQTLRLYDRYTEKYVDLNKNTSYSFEVTNDPKSKGHRFDIVMGVDVVTSIPKQNSEFKTFLMPNPAENEVMVSVQRPDLAHSTHLRVVDMQGRVLYATSFSAEAESQVMLSLNQMRKGVYLVEVSHGALREVKRLIVN